MQEQAALWDFLNHQKMQFELLHMGQSAEVQKRYWNLLRTSRWNNNRSDMPKYAVLEAVLVENPDFDNLDELTPRIIETADYLASEIMCYLDAT